MKYPIQVVITTDEGQTETQDIACPEREDLTLTILGLTLADGKAILKALQEVVVQQQMTAYLETQRPYGHCCRVQRSTGYHTTQVRTVFGTIPVHSLRLYQRPCHPEASTTFSPLAASVPEHITPELLFLETKWATSTERPDVASTQTHAEVSMALAGAQGFGLRLEQGRILRGWALAMRGDAAAGVAPICQGLAASQGVGPEILRPHWLALLAEAYGQAGQPEAGLTVLAEALTLVATTEARWWEADLSRLRGELLLQHPHPQVPQAETCLSQALDVARRQ